MYRKNLSTFRIFSYYLGSHCPKICVPSIRNIANILSHNFPFVWASNYFDIKKFTLTAKLSVFYVHVWKHTQSLRYSLQIFVPAHVENCSTHYFHDIPIYPIANHNLEAHKSWRKEKKTYLQIVQCSFMKILPPSILKPHKSWGQRAETISFTFMWFRMWRLQLCKTRE